MTHPDWPLGPALRAHREAAALSIRAAADKAGISEGKWRQLESGKISVRQGVTVPTRSTPQTVAAAARAVRLPVPEALRLAGFEPDGYAHLDSPDPDDRVPGFAQLSDTQRDAIVALVASILSGERADTSDGRAQPPIRAGQAPPDLLQQPGVKVFPSDPPVTERAGESS